MIKQVVKIKGGLFVLENIWLIFSMVPVKWDVTGRLLLTAKKKCQGCYSHEDLHLGWISTYYPATTDT